MRLWALSFEVLGSTETGGIAWRQRRFTDNEKSAVAASAWKTVEGIQAAVKVDSRYLPAGEDSLRFPAAT